MEYVLYCECKILNNNTTTYKQQNATYDNKIKFEIELPRIVINRNALYNLNVHIHLNPNYFNLIDDVN